jgi:hypothetical protein
MVVAATTSIKAVPFNADSPLSALFLQVFGRRIENFLHRLEDGYSLPFEFLKEMNPSRIKR